MDLLIAGMGRAGTTLLANLLTNPPGHWVITEPGITRGDMSDHVRQQAIRYGFDIDAGEWTAGGPTETSLARFQRVLAPRLAGLRWGVKEVNPAGYDELLRIFTPGRIVIAVRDIRDCALSLLEKHARNPKPGPHNEESWMHGRLLDAAKALVKIHRSAAKGTVRVVRYEDFVRDLEERAALGAWLDWPMDGDPARCLDLYGRADEPLKHAGTISSASVDRRTSEHRPEWLAFADRLARDAADYQTDFGYTPTSAPAVAAAVSAAPATPPAPATPAPPPAASPKSAAKPIAPEPHPVARPAPAAPALKAPRIRVIMGRRHREKILQFLRPGTRMLEWGAGGSTVWLADNLPEGATLTSVEHDPKWFQTVRENIGAHPRVRLLLREATGPLGANATIEEEAADVLQSFVHAVDGEKFDLIMVDGNARHGCLDRARDLLAPGGIVMLHDAQRAWYDDAKRLYTGYGHIGSCPDYPSPHLWWGGLSELSRPQRTTGELPLIISFFTRNTDYEIEARKLIATCERLGLDHYVAGLDSRGSWEANCSLKSEFVYETWRTCRRPVLWVDADAVLHDAPELLRGATADFAIHRCRGWQFASGTVFFNQTPGAAALIERWIARCRSHPRVWDQDNLDLAWEDTVATRPMETLWLPEPYCRIFDLDEGRSAAPGIIEHFQASRRLKTRISDVVPTPPVPPNPVLQAARAAARPRPWLLSAVDGVTRQEHAHRPKTPVAHAGALHGLVDLLTALVPPPGKVLAVADGIGVLWRLISEHGYEAHGLTDSSDYLADAELFAPGRLRLGLPTALPHPDDSFDIVLCQGRLEQLSEKDLTTALTEVVRVSRREVFLIVQTGPDPEARWPAAAIRPKSWWLGRLSAVGLQPQPAAPGAPHAAYLQQEQGCIVMRCRKPATRRPSAPALPPAPAAAGAPASTKIAVPTDLAAFTAQVGTFFQTDDLVQIDWADTGIVALTEHKPGAAEATLRTSNWSGYHPRLPLADESVQTVFNLGTVGQLDDMELPGWLAELERIVTGNVWIAVEATPGRDRAWWEQRAIEAGFRKHPLAQCVTGFEELNNEGDGLLLLLEKIPTAARLASPLSALRAERDLHADMLREPGIRSDAHLARYVLARESVQPGSMVLDAACGLGYGAAILGAGTGAARVYGVDLSETSITYARAHYASTQPNLDFHAHDATRLPWLADASVDLAVSFETLEHLPTPGRLLAEFARVLKPGGTLVASVPNLWINEQGHNPVPYHLHVYDWEQLRDQVGVHFDIKHLYRQNAGGGWKRLQPRILRELAGAAPTATDLRDAEWWIVVASKRG